MLYQNILGENTPYQAFVTGMSAFPAHRHADLELAFCLCGEYDVLLDRRRYTVKEGEIVLISPMTVHEIPPSFSPERRVLTVVLGPSLLREDYAAFTAASFRTPVLTPEALTDDPETLRAALLEVASLAGQYTPTARLCRMSALYRIMAVLAAALDREEGGDGGGDLRKVAGIEPALELIWHSYRTPLTVEQAAAVSGYGKSNFCKIFRTVTGESFHRTLNRRRIRAACDLLTGTDLPIASVGAEVGLPEAKTFCRVFREIEGVTPGAYRRGARAAK